VKIWLIFEEVDGALVDVIMGTFYERGDSGPADLEQALEGYPREDRSVHVLELEVRLGNASAGAKGPSFAVKWVNQT
jgi:hypothetical protein